MRTVRVVLRTLCVLLMTSMASVQATCRVEDSHNYTTYIPFSSAKDVEDDVVWPVPEIQHVCYNQSHAVCWCTVDEMNCSGNNGTLTFIPKVNGTILFLNFTYNHLEEIGEDFFTSVTHLTHLDLGDNHNLHYIHPQAFKPLTNLQQLFLDYDYALTLNYRRLEPVFSISTLTRLDVRVGDLGPLPDDLFLRHPMPYLQTFYVHSNEMKSLNMTVLKPLTNLRTFGAAHNKLSCVHADNAHSLEKLNLCYNNLLTFPRTCRYWEPLYPKLKQLFLRDNKIKKLSKDVCLPSLQLLDLSGNYIKVIYEDMFSSRFFPSLTELFLQFMSKHMFRIEARAFDNRAIQTLSLLYNHFYFDNNSASADSFQGCTGLQNLLLGHNQIRNNDFIRVFGHLKTLQYLHLGSNIMGDISRDTFSAFPELSTLCMYQNELTNLPEGAFDSLTQLVILELNDNKLQTVPSTVFTSQLQTVLHHLDLSENPYRCDCDILWFQAWVKSAPALFSNSWGYYYCKTPSPRTNLVDFIMAEQACLLPQYVSVLVLVIGSLLLGIGMLGSMFFRFRWYLRLLLHEAYKGRGEGWKRRQCASNFDYDVFVCYSQEDLTWVTTQLLPELEVRQGLRLCIHDRDFIPGQYIVDNIVKCLQKSRKTVMLFSTSFAQSPWCQFELALCLHHAIDMDDSLVVLCLHDIPSRHLTPTMMAIFYTTTYIQWQDDDGDAMASFWGRVCLALYELIPCPRPGTEIVNARGGENGHDVRVSITSG